MESTIKTESKKACYYKSRTSRADALMLREMVSFCDKEATKTLFLSVNKSIKRLVCDSERCWEKAKADLNIIFKEQKQKRETEKKIKKLRGVGLSDSEIYQRWDELK